MPQGLVVRFGLGLDALCNIKSNQIKSKAHGLHDPEGPSAVHPIEGLGEVEEEHSAVGVVGGEQVGELGVGEDVVADPAAGQEAGLGGVDDGLQGGGLF